MNPRELTPWLYGRKRPTALIVHNSPSYGVNTILRAMDFAGLQVPKDISIIIFGVRDQYRVEGFPFTTMVEPFYDVGKTAVGALMDKVEGRATTLRVMEFPFELVPGKSCAPLHT